MSQPHDGDPEPQADPARYSVVLRSIGPNKIAVIQLTRVVHDLKIWLTETKELVESLGVVRSGLTLEEAQALAARYSEDGASCEIRRE
jgi:ribosomal protein L7/L12